MRAIGNMGRIVFAIPFIIFGILHFVNSSEMASMMLNGWPAAVFLVQFSGLAMLLAGVSIIINVYAKIASLLLAILMFLIIIGVHVPGLFDEQSMQTSLVMILKDFTMLGGALLLAKMFRDREF